MKKIHQLFIALVMLAFSSASYAEMKYGVSGALTFVNASGTETEGASTSVEKTTASADNTVVVPSVFAEYAYTDTVAIGLDYIPLKADVSNKAKSRTSS